MDLVYLLFVFGLCAVVLGFLLVCDRLDPRKQGGIPSLPAPGQTSVQP